MHNIHRPLFSTKKVLSVIDKNKCNLISSVYVSNEKVFVKNVKRNVTRINSLLTTTALLTNDDQINYYTNRFVRNPNYKKQFYNNILYSTHICPYCGLKDIQQLDHYLDKSDIPLLAITPLNLVPSCYDCNHTKMTIKPVTNIYFFNPYFHFIDYQWFKFVINVSANNIPVFSFKRINSNQINDKYIDFTISKLGLINKYNSYANTRFFNKREIYLNYKKSGINYFKKTLENNYKKNPESLNEVENVYNRCLYENYEIIFNLL